MNIEIINSKTSCKENQSLAGRILLKKMIKSLYGVDDFNIFYNENGKPLTDFCYFNISHSENFVTCAVSDLPIGVDIEKIKQIKQRKSYYLFSENEAKYVNCKNFTNRFLTIWTRKEAYIKAIGEKLIYASSVNLVNDNLELIDVYDGYKLTTEIHNEYVISVAEKNYL